MGTFAEGIADLLEEIRDAGLSASTDSAKVNTPGVWLRVDDLQPLVRLGGARRVATTLHVVVQGQALDDAWEPLETHLDTVLSILNGYGGPSGPIIPTALQLQPSGTGLPAFAVPFAFRATTTEE